MVRTVIAINNLENYLEKLSKQQKITIGLIIGQICDNDKDYVVHMARTPNDTADDLSSNASSSVNSIKSIESVIDIDNNLIANHSLSVIRMLPGGFYILGVFIVGPTSVFDDEKSLRKVHDILYEIKTILNVNSLLFGNYEKYNNNEKLVFQYITSGQKKSFLCKSMEIFDSFKTQVKTIDWKFSDKVLNWHMIETLYDMDEIFPLIKTNNTNEILEKNFSLTLEMIYKQLKNSLIFFDNEQYDKNDVFDKIIKFNNLSILTSTTGSSTMTINDANCIQAIIYLPCTISNTGENDSGTVIMKYDGTMRYFGIVCSRVWVHNKNTINDIETFIKSDIMRSLTSRIQLHCDSLVEATNENPDIILNEPPRRCFFQLNNSTNIQFSDYIFRGENEDIIIKQTKELLDIDIQKQLININVETLTDINNDLYNNTINNITKTETNRIMYIFGILFALLALIISIFINFLINY